MKDELYNEIKQYYLKEKEEQEEKNNKIEEINTLIEDSKVKRFIELTNFDIEKYTLEQTDEDIIGELFRNSLNEIDIEDTNNIYVYMGTYKKENEEDIKVSNDDPNASFKCYSNIELSYNLKIPIDLCEEFEKENDVIYIDNPEKAYFDIQEEFVVKAIKTTQRRAKRHILKKYKG